MLKLKKIYESSYFPFLILCIAMIILHINMIPFGDDNFFGTVLNNKNLFQYLNERYYGWSSRLTIESIMVIILSIGFNFWRILDVLVINLLAITLSKLFNDSNNREFNWFITIMIILYSFIDMSSAGWVATTLNYIWPLTFGIFSLMYIKKMIQKSEIHWYEYVLYLLATLYAGNEEQMCVILIPIYSVFIIYLTYIKRKTLFLYIQNLICFIYLVLILSTPGNSVRKAQEISTWYPDYNMLTFIDKIKLGITTTMAEYIATPNLIFISISLLIFVSVYIRYKKSMYRWIAGIPFFSVLILGVGGNIGLFNIFSGIGTYIMDPIYGITDFKEINVYNFDNFTAYIPIALCIIIIGCLVASIYLIFGNSATTFLLLLISILGFLSRMALVFSPTLYASSDRTYIFFTFALVIVGIFIYNDLNFRIDKNKNKIIFNFISCLAILNFFNTLVLQSQLIAQLLNS
ncbi:conserved membrane hypothetical protein [Clostridium neonatale]|uniref:hypothetical protein n=1 Tax=Clostridium neonatale TaxID=137838 RepID=UPI001D38F7A4|nr:hypothetical protein [Clostridium neonatale]CAG9713317.1 conserved membrane hypothetical protein [Clostridium neonatale]